EPHAIARLGAGVTQERDLIVVGPAHDDVGPAVAIEVTDHGRAGRTVRPEVPVDLEGPVASANQDRDGRGDEIGGDEIENPVPVDISRREGRSPLAGLEVLAELERSV